MSKKRKVLIEFLAYTFLFMISIVFLPMFNIYLVDENDQMEVKPQYIMDFKLLFTEVICFLAVLVAFLTSYKPIIKVVNIICLLVTFLMFGYIKLEFGFWGGSPFHPDFSYGYYLAQSIFILMTIRTFILLSQKKRIENEDLLDRL